MLTHLYTTRSNANTTSYTTLSYKTFTQHAVTITQLRTPRYRTNTTCCHANKTFTQHAVTHTELLHNTL